MPTRRRPHCYPSQVPAINQLPYGVGFSGYYGGNAASVLEANRKRGVLVQAWSPLRKALSGARNPDPNPNPNPNPNLRTRRYPVAQFSPVNHPWLQGDLCTSTPPLRRGQGGVRRHRQGVRQERSAGRPPFPRRAGRRLHHADQEPLPLRGARRHLTRTRTLIQA